MINSFNILKSNTTGFADMWSSLLRIISRNCANAQ